MPTLRIDDFSPGFITEYGEDILPPGAALEIRNFKLDKKGRLVTASGPVLAFKATAAAPEDPVRQLFSWRNPADSVRWVFAVINRAVYGFSGAYKNDSDMTQQYSSLADWASSPLNTPAMVGWRSVVLLTSPVDPLLRFDGTSWAPVVMQDGGDPEKAYLTQPPSGCALEVFGERLYILDGTRVRYSEVGWYDVFDANGFFFVRESDGFTSKTMKVFAGRLYIFKERSVDALVGGAPPDGGQLVEVNGEVGLLAPNSLVETENFLLWASHIGVMRMDRAGNIVNISKPIQGFFTSAYAQKGTISNVWDEAASQDESVSLGDESMILADSEASGGELINLLVGASGVDVSILEYAAGAYKDGWYYLSVPLSDGSVRTFACSADEPAPRWLIWEGEGMGGCAMCRLAGASDPTYIYAGKWNKPEVVALDAGGPLPTTAFWRSKNFDGGAGLMEKEYRRLRAIPEVDADTAPFTVGWEVNPGEGRSLAKSGSYQLTPDVTRAGRQRMEKSFPMTAVGMELGLTLETNGPCEIAALEVDWLPRRVR